MKHFRSGITDTTTLRNEYKKLAKKYHPDYSTESNAEEIFKEINAEYHEYQKLINLAANIPKQPKYTFIPSPYFIAFVYRDEDNVLYIPLNVGIDCGYFTTIRDYHYTISNELQNDRDLGWAYFEDGLTFCMFPEGSDYRDMYRSNTIIQRRDTPDNVLCYADAAEVYRYLNQSVEVDDLWAYDSPKIITLTAYNGDYIYATKFNNSYYEIFVSTTVDPPFITNADKETKFGVHKIFISGKELGEDREDGAFKIYHEETFFEFLLREYFQMTEDEFKLEFDVDSVPKYFDQMGFVKLDKDEIIYGHPDVDPAVYVALKESIIDIYYVKKNRSKMFGYFRKNHLLNKLNEITFNDVIIIQKFFNQIWGELDDYYYYLVRKGKLPSNI